MNKFKKILTGEAGIFLYKLLNDVLILLIISFALLLVSESVMPGLISSHFSFTRLTLTVFVVLGMIIYLGKLNEISFEIENKKTVLLYSLIIFSILLIINSLLKFAWWEIIIITTAAFSVVFYLYKITLKKNHNS
ncbi:MAG: hypothetical protein Q7S18_01715 [bacterium]|nr:hypothetical protein [bacterium]